MAEGGGELGVAVRSSRGLRPNDRQPTMFFSHILGATYDDAKSENLYPNSDSSSKFLAMLMLLAACADVLTNRPSARQVNGQYGWNSETYKCDFLNTNVILRSNWFLISWSIPCVIIVISYSLIFIKVKQSGRSILRGK